MTEPADPALRRVIVLLMVNLALSALLAVLAIIFRDQVINYQLHRMTLPAGADVGRIRAGLGVQVWVRAGAIVLVSLVYLYLVRRLRAGHRRAYYRVVALSVIGVLSLVLVVVTGQYPAWMRVEQVVQAGVLLALLWAVTRPAVRQRFARQPEPVPAGPGDRR